MLVSRRVCWAGGLLWTRPWSRFHVQDAAAILLHCVANREGGGGVDGSRKTNQRTWSTHLINMYTKDTINCTVGGWGGWGCNMMSLGESWLVLFLMPSTGVADPLLYYQEEVLGLWMSGISCWQRRVSSWSHSIQRPLLTMRGNIYNTRLDLVLDTELCVLGSLSQHTVAMDTCHPVWMTQSMNWYVQEHLWHQFQHWIQN